MNGTLKGMQSEMRRDHKYGGPSFQTLLRRQMTEESRAAILLNGLYDEGQTPKESLKAANGLLAFLPFDQETVIRMRFGIGEELHILKSVAKRLGLSGAEPVRNIEDKAAAKLIYVADHVPIHRILTLGEERFFKLDIRELDCSIPEQHLLANVIHRARFKFILKKHKNLRHEDVLQEIISSSLPIDVQIAKDWFGVGSKKGNPYSYPPASQIIKRFNSPPANVGEQVDEAIMALARVVKEINSEVDLYAHSRQNL